VSLPRIEIAIAAGNWGGEKKWRALAETAVAAAIETAGLRLPSAGELSILLTDDAAIRELNRRWRSLDKPTNVLSFPANENVVALPQGGVPVMLGDIVLARETLESEADLALQPFDHHFSHLVIHGFLHLFGYDHLEEADAEQMEQIERKALRKIGLPDPYATER